jgi:hypothetical protein
VSGPTTTSTSTAPTPTTTTPRISTTPAAGSGSDVEKWFDEIKQKLMEAIKDAHNLDVITVIADDITIISSPITEVEDLKKVNIKSLKYYTRTNIQLEGDLYTILPGAGDPNIRDQVLQYHERSVKSAIQNYNNFASVVLRAIVIIAGIAGADIPDKIYDIIPKLTWLDKNTQALT